MQFELKIIGNAAEIAHIMNSVSGGAVSVAMIGTNDEDEPAGVPPVQIAPGEVDAAGFPWDSRIHSGGKTKTQAGNWRYAKGVQTEIVTAVETELRARAAAPAATPPVPMFDTGTNQGGTPPLPPPANAAPVAAPPASAPPAAPPAAASVPAGPPLTDIAAGTMDFATFMQHVSNSMQAKKIDQEGAFIAWIAQTLGVANIAEIAPFPDKIAQAYNLMLREKRIVGQ